jgi:glucose dehydrogenase
LYLDKKKLHMALLRSIKNEYEFFHHQKLDALIALDKQNSKIVSSFWKSNKGKKNTTLPKTKAEGYKFILDEEFDSLKIDFTQSFMFEAKDLVKAK